MGSKVIKTTLILLLVLYFLFLVIARVPAAWAVWAVHRATPDVRLTGVSGTLWEGRATGGTAMVNGQFLPLEDVRWKVNPWTLMGLNACAAVELDVLAQPASGTVCGRPGGVITAQDLQLSAPMAIVGNWVQLPLGGLASLQIQELRLQNERVEALQGNLSWRDARWNDGDRWFSLGAFAAKLTANAQGGVHANIFELDGPFDVDLAGDFVPGQEPAIQGTVVPTADAPAPIRDAIQFVGEPLDGGGYRLAWPPGT